MYGISRWCLRTACLAAWANVVMLVLLVWPTSLVGVAMVVFHWRGKIKRLTTLGSARWATLRDLRVAGMLDANSGLILGRFQGEEE